jgi:translation elongation factor EF-1beta
MTFTMGVNNLSDDVQEAIKRMEDEVQSVEITSINVSQTDTTFITFPLHDFIVSTGGKY